eukprot:3533557-Rhodomonas_salina.1
MMLGVGDGLRPAAASTVAGAAKKEEKEDSDWDFDLSGEEQGDGDGEDSEEVKDDITATAEMESTSEEGSARIGDQPVVGEHVKGGMGEEISGTSSTGNDNKERDSLPDDEGGQHKQGEPAEESGHTKEEERTEEKSEEGERGAAAASSPGGEGQEAAKDVDKIEGGGKDDEDAFGDWPELGGEGGEEGEGKGGIGAQEEVLDWTGEKEEAGGKEA